MRSGKYSWTFDNVYLGSTGTAVGIMESEGPLAEYFDVCYDDQYCGQQSWEKAESQLMMTAVEQALKKLSLSIEEVDIAFAGDLINQIIPSHYTFRNYAVPFFGLYGACSTSMESLVLASILVDSHNADCALAATSSHNSTAERQFRNPTEYGGPKNETSQYTITGSGAAIVCNKKSAIRIESATAGVIIDTFQKNPSDMGTAMAPAAAHTIKHHLEDLNLKPDYYDLILTGDLAHIGSPILIDILKEDGIDISEQHDDCGKLIFSQEQPVFAGGSGCGCCAVVTYGYIKSLLLTKKIKRVLVVATGALLNTMILQQRETIPCIAHAVALSVEE